MRKIAFVAGVAALVAMTGAASADGYGGVARVYEQPFSWSGFYLGGSAGLVTGQTTGDVGLGGPLNTERDSQSHINTQRRAPEIEHETAAV